MAQGAVFLPLCLHGDIDTHAEPVVGSRLDLLTLCVRVVRRRPRPPQRAQRAVRRNTNAIVSAAVSCLVVVRHASFSPAKGDLFFME